MLQQASPVAVEPLDAALTAQLVGFARACKGAARAVALYPPEHPAIRTTLHRLVETAAEFTSRGSLSMSVIPGSLLLDGRPPARPDLAVAELAELLHHHLVGELVVLPGADEDAWQKFLAVLARTPDEVAVSGGFNRTLAEAAGHHIEVREIDYAEVLRERWSGEEASWQRIIENCLAGDAVELDESALKELADIARDVDRLCGFTARLEERGAAHGGIRTQTAALLRVFRSVAKYVGDQEPEQLGAVLDNMATAACRLSPELMLEILSARQRPASQTDGGDTDGGTAGAGPGGGGATGAGLDGGAGGAGAAVDGAADDTPAEGAPSGPAPGAAPSGDALDIVSEIVGRVGDSMVAQFVARSVVTEHGATVRLAEAFQALVPDATRRETVLDLARQQVAGSPLAVERGFDRLWARVEEMLSSYSDRPYVSEAYNRELTGARVQALEIERITDDPPERIAAWLATISDLETRTLDLRMLLDLIEVEPDPFRWRELVNVVVPHVEDLVLIGDFDAARLLVAAMAETVASPAKAVRRAAAVAAIERLAEGDLLDNTATHLQTLSDEKFEAVKGLCREMGSVLVDPLAEMLSLEQRARVRQRLTELLLTYGAEGRQAAEQLMLSPNPSVRRTAVYLLREFGGNEALPELDRLLGDKELHVQREAMRALLQIGTDEALALLERRLTTADAASREALMRELALVRDHRVAPLFCYIVRHTEPRGAMLAVALKAIERLGELGGSEAVEVLDEALRRGTWWTPFRTRRVRDAAARALARLATPEAEAALAAAAASGSRGVRRIARAKGRE